VTPELAEVRWRIQTELPRGQARVALSLLCLPEDPVASDLCKEIMAERRRQLDARHSALMEERRRRSRLWVRRHWAAEYRQAHRVWPWQAYQSDCGVMRLR
jgi:hypothetical protein